MTELEFQFGPDSNRLHCPLENFSGTGTLLSGQPGCPGQIPDRYLLFCSQWAGGRSNYHQFVATPVLGNQTGFVRRAFNQSKIKMSGRQLLLYLSGISNHEIYPGPAITPGETTDYSRQKVVANCRTRTDSQVPGRITGSTGNPFEHYFGAVQNLNGFLQQQSATIIQYQLFPDTIEQITLQLSFKVRQIQTDRGLGHTKLFAGIGDMTKLRHGNKNFKLSQRYIHRLLLIPINF